MEKQDLPAVALENCSTSVFSVSQGPSSMVENNLDTQIKIYPNPSQGQIILSSDIVGAFDVQVLDVVGRVIYSEKFVDLSSYTMNLDQEGVYLVNFISIGFSCFI